MTGTTPERDRAVESRTVRDGNGNGAHREPDEHVVTSTTPAEDVRTVLVNRITWSAVFAGVAISLITQLLLNMLGLGIGIGAIDPNAAAGAVGTGAAANDSGGWGWGAALWWGIAGIVAAALGGYAAGRLSGRPERSTAAWHGLVSWAFATLAIVWLLGSTVNQIVGGAASTAATVTQGQAGGVAQSGLLRSVVPTNLTRAAAPFTAVEQQFRADTGDPNAVRDLALVELRELTTATTPTAQAAARERANLAVARALNVQPNVAAQRVAFYEQQYRAAQSRPVLNGQQTVAAITSTISWSMIGAAIALMLAALAAWWAGGAAAVHPTITAAARSLRDVRRVRTTTTGTAA